MSELENNMAFEKSVQRKVAEIINQNSMHIVEIGLADAQDDLKHSTDFKVRVTRGDIAVRVRRHSCHGASARDLTIRAVCGNAKTEIHKIRDGYADWYLYAWEDEYGELSEWILVDIRRMRNTGLLYQDRHVIMNRDGYTGFIPYTKKELRKYECIIAECPCVAKQMCF